MAKSYIEVTHENFPEQVLNSPRITIVNFSADKIGACQILEPEFEAVSQEYNDRITFAKVNVEHQRDLAQQWKVDGVPTLIFFKGGSELYRIEGVTMRDRLRRQIEGVLLAN